MKLVLLSGGSGKRLWPLSNDSRSKQFLRVFHHKTGSPISMLQRTWSKLADHGLHKNAYICASKAQYDIVISQLGDVPFIEEPSRRDTFPAIALAVSALASDGLAEDEVIVVMPSDHMVDDLYFEQLSKLEAVLMESDADLALIGVKPTEPTSKFGYIKLSEDAIQRSDLWWKPVDSFVEKPGMTTARSLIEKGALWNCGVFAFKLGYLIRLLKDRGYPEDYETMRELFHTLPKRSFDYEVVEQAASVVVIPYAGKWKDLGTWESLSEELNEEMIGKGKVVQCENTHIINELGIPVVAMGLKDAMVVASPDGVLVTDKKMSVNLKEAIQDFDDRPMYEERLWGMYRVLDYQKLGDETEVLTRWIELLPGHNLSYQRHQKRSEHWTLLQGSGEMVLDGVSTKVHPGDAIRIGENTWHALRAIDKLVFIEVQRGSELIEEDIERKFLTWDELEEYVLR